MDDLIWPVYYMLIKTVKITNGLNQLEEVYIQLTEHNN